MRARVVAASAAVVVGMAVAAACSSSGGSDGSDAASSATSTSLPVAGPEFAGDPRFITDPQGRVLVLHGLNVSNSAKGDPARVGDTTQADIDRIADDWDFNASRHLIFWDAVEPEEGHYDEEYLDRVEDRLDWYQEAGISVILDMHQDIYSAAFDGDGAPTWAIRNGGVEFSSPHDIPFTQKYLDPAVIASFKTFWENGETATGRGLRDAYAAAWQHVAERFAGHPAVIGYDIMNEPNLVRYPALQDFTQQQVDAIREVDDEHWIFFEPISTDPGFGRPVGLERVDDPRPGPPRLVYAPHLYEPAVHEGAPYRDDNRFVDDWLGDREDDLATLDSALVIGEFGVGQQAGFRNYLDDVTAAADDLEAGWTYWSYDPGGWGPAAEDGSEQAQVERLVRTYPQRIAGTPTEWSYDPTTTVFVLRWDEAPGVVGPTVVSVPAARHYPDGFEVVSTDGEGTWSQQFDEDRELLSVDADPDEPHHALCVAPTARACTRALAGPERPSERETSEAP